MVLNNGLMIAKAEKARIDVIALSAIFHDVCYYTASYEEHGHEGAKHAMEYMRKKNYPNDLIANVTYAIDVHVGEMNPKTVEAKIIQDADTLDKVGAIGISLILLNAGARKLLFLDALKQYKTDYEKNLNFMLSSIWTSAARQIMSERTNFLTNYFKQLENELTRI